MQIYGKMYLTGWIAMKNKISIIILLFLFPVIFAGQKEQQAANDVVLRTFGSDAASLFEFRIVPQDGNDSYILSVEGRKVIVEGNSVGALCRGAYDYLKNQCAGIFTWSGKNLEIPSQLPAIDKKVSSPFEFRYYFNVVTHSYTTPFWTWERWEKELDWMALHGINMPLIPGATEAIQYRTFVNMGLEPDAVKKFFAGPAYFAFSRMGVIAGWDNQIPDSYFDKQIALNHKILARMRELGMTPIVPAFAGFVPDTFEKHFPEVKITRLKWAEFEEKYRAPLILPDNKVNQELFIKVGAAYVREWEKEFGSNIYYLSDTFNEMDVPLSSDYNQSLKQMNDYGSTIYKSISEANPQAVWTMQGWTFPYYKNKLGQIVWTPERLESFVSSIPDDKILFLDLANDYNKCIWKIPFSWKNYTGFFGKKWIYSTIPNMGGKIACTGVLDFYANGVAEVLAYSEKGNLIGYGTAPEGIENNEIVYELIADAAWQEQAIDLDSWIADYCMQKYGYNGPEMLKAWDYFRKSCYGTFTPHPRHDFQFRPSSKEEGSAHDMKNFYLGVQAFASCYDKCDTDLYVADLIDFTSQYLGFAADKMLHKSWHKVGSFRLKSFEKSFELLTSIDNLLESHPNLRLQNWIDYARSWGDSADEKDYYESNAKRIITTWGPGVNDYSARLWSGMVKDYYGMRWLKAAQARRKYEKFDIKVWEEDWITSPWVNNSQKFENPVQSALDLINKYKKVL